MKIEIARMIAPFIFTPVILYGLYHFFVRLYRYMKSRESLNWRKTGGIVMSAIPETKQTRTERRVRGGKTVTDVETSHQVTLTYSYEVNGKRFTGSNVRYGENPEVHSKKQAGELARVFTEGKKILVYYNPRNPSQAVLVPGADVYDFLFEAGSGIGMSIVGAVLLAFTLSM